jgi:hypothetical protein
MLYPDIYVSIFLRARNVLNQVFEVLCSDSKTFLRCLVYCVLIPKHSLGVWCVVF